MGDAVRLVSGNQTKVSQDTHILPLAREVDRAVLPFVANQGQPPILHAHKIVLLVPPNELGRRVASKVERALRTVALIERLELASDRERPTAGFNGILQQVSALCVRELDVGNRVHINLSSGTKLVAFAAGLAGMAHLGPGRGSIYYVQPAGIALSQADFDEHGHTKGVLSVEELELMPVLLPEPLQLRVLTYLKAQPDTRAEYRELVRFLTEVPGSGFSAADTKSAARLRNWNNAVTTRMVRKILAPLQRNGLIEILDAGRQKSTQLTTKGLLYASIGGVNRSRLRAPVMRMNSTTSTLIHGRV